MKKQEWVQKYLEDILSDAWRKGGRKEGIDVTEEADKARLHLAKWGVVIRVESNTADFIKCPCDDCTAEHKLIDEWGYFCDMACGKRSYWIARCRGHEDMAGYVATIPLIEEDGKA